MLRVSFSQLLASLDPAALNFESLKYVAFVVQNSRGREPNQGLVSIFELLLIFFKN